MIGKWNYETREYDPYYPDPNWEIVLYTEDMSQLISCTSCGKELTYGDSYTSLELHTEFGMGYPVCSNCYDVEWERKKKYGR